MFSLIGILAMIMVRTLRRDIANYNKDEDMVSEAKLFIKVFFLLKDTVRSVSFVSRNPD